MMPLTVFSVPPSPTMKRRRRRDLALTIGAVAGYLACMGGVFAIIFR